MTDCLNYKFASFEVGSGREHTVNSLLGIEDVVEDRTPISDRLLCTIGGKDGPLFFAHVEAQRGSIVSRISVKMALEAISSTALEYYHAQVQLEPSILPLSSALVQETFKEAKRLLRFVLDRYLGHKPLVSRQLLRRKSAAPEPSN